MGKNRWYVRIDDYNKFIEECGEMKKYLRVYNKEDIILFRSRSKDYKILSNFHVSSSPLPFQGKEFTSVEQMLFYRIVNEYADMTSLKDRKEEICNLIMSQKTGREVKVNKEIRAFDDQIDKEVKAKIGKMNWSLIRWQIAYQNIKIKLDYCKEFREMLEANYGKYFCEDSHWGDWRAGVLLCVDETSEYYGKYIGCNYTGRAIQRALVERNS